MATHFVQLSLALSSGLGSLGLLTVKCEEDMARDLWAASTAHPSRALASFTGKDMQSHRPKQCVKVQVSANNEQVVKYGSSMEDLRFHHHSRYTGSQELDDTHFKQESKQNT